MRGIAITAGDLHSAADDAAVSGFHVRGQAVPRDSDKYEIHFDLETYNSLRGHFPEGIGDGDSALEICKGISVKLGKSSQSDPAILHCEEEPKTMNVLKNIHKNPQWLGRQENQKKVIIAVWAA